MANRDPTTLSNYSAWRTKHTTVNFKLDFDRKLLKGAATLQLESQTDKGSNEVILDTRFINVQGVNINSAEAKWELKPHSDPFGAPLHVSVPGGAAKGDVINVAIDLETTAKCTALQWLTPAQTSNKKHPYMFSQCQAINARSIFPCQDTPDVKSTFTFRLTSSLPVVASGVPVGDHTPAVGTEKTYEFEQKVPIPSYLFAVASGDIVSAKIGSRSVVVTGPNELDECRWELERDMDKFMEVAERLVFPYKWGEYNVLVLPPSFPYGGMENPIYTFATPTIISGDRQNVDVIAHELSHSWSGNLVSNASWEHFWLNEGWTVYLERRIQSAIHGEAEFDFSSIIGWKALEDAVELFGKDHEYTKLIISHKNVDPEDVYSTIAYEKGFHFLYYLDRLVGREAFDKFIPHYFAKWSGKSLDSFEFRDTFVDFFNHLGDEAIKQKIATIDWDGRFYTPGLPPKPDFDLTMVTACYELATKWKDVSFEPKPEDVSSFTANQKIVFLDKLQESGPLSVERAQLLGKIYDFISSKNVELKSSYYRVALEANDPTCVYGVAELLGSVGRMKFVRPLFRGLNKVDRKLALETFEKNKDFYHPICRGMVEKDLGIHS
ncbi:Leukotriene A-4 hydrolase-like protein [Metarhizium anisopliae BRIP 53293]|uniref:Leukotriene A(4) hydrolase n=1 Tax=Metarhizium anisopliae BRIP 53293 TaxID=1291518 RepID=A0A0D9PIF1_METAN|nr:Leukotriene A-4 hydrolase-like protein [Metarhizium anisopliae BRIP 53293]KJK88673.1 Leukotriene A-4 hydrolase-like protein [Metarhizium anisopliae BRIP 53284]